MKVPEGSSPSRNSQMTHTSLAEINVTPFVDIMLVLLIVFMVSAPLMQQGVQVDLPQAESSALNETPKQLLLSVDRRKQISLNGKKIEKGTLRKRLLAIAAVQPKTEVFVQADRRVPYGYIAQVIAEVKQAKLSRVGLVTQPGKPQSPL